MNCAPLCMELPVEKQLRIEQVKRNLESLSRQELEAELIRTLTALITLSHTVTKFFEDNGHI